MRGFGTSAAYDAASNWIVIGRVNIVGEFRFFLSDYLVCLAETIFDCGYSAGSVKNQTLRTGLCKRFLGSIWVVMTIFSLSPAWQYSLIRTAVAF